MKKPNWKKFVSKKVYSFTFGEMGVHPARVTMFRNEIHEHCFPSFDDDIKQVIEKIERMQFEHGFIYARNLNLLDPNIFYFGFELKTKY